MWKRRIALVLLSTGLFVAPALGQTREYLSYGIAAPYQQAEDAGWQRLRAVKPGTRLVVARREGPDLKVRLETVADDALHVRGSRGPLTIRRGDVVAIYQDHRFTTKEFAGIGALVGAGAGLALGAAADSNNGGELSGLAVRLFPIAGALYGSLGGLLIGGAENQNPPRLIYRAPAVARQ